MERLNFDEEDFCITINRMGTILSEFDRLEKNDWAMTFLRANGFDEKDIKQGKDLLLKFKAALDNDHDLAGLFMRGAEN